MKKLRVIIGQGTATEAYRATRQDEHEFDTIVIGPRGLWAALPPQHSMGQTPQALTLPGQPVPAFTHTNGQTNLNGFLDVGNYQRRLLALAQCNDQRCGTIRVLSHGTEIQLNGIMATTVEEGFHRGQVLVCTSDPEIKFNADQVIIATGIGPQQRPNPPNGIHGAPATGLAYKQIQEGVEYINSTPVGVPLDVAVFGGSATSAWVVDEVLARNARRLLWFTRLGGSEFTGCTLPGDRNYQVLQATQNRRLLADLIRIDYLPEKRAAGRVLRRPMVKLTLRPTTGPEKICLVDQLIHSIGGDPAAEGSIARMLEPSIRRRLQPLRDINRVISDGSGVLALATPEKEVVIIGSATYNYTDYYTRKQTAPLATLPRASQVPDGIAMVVASVSAMNSYAPFKQDQNGRLLESNININLADRDQLAIYLTLFYPDLGPTAVNEIVARTINLRSSKRPGKEFGISESEFDQIIGQYL